MEPNAKLYPMLTWRAAFASKYGPPNTTRSVLFVLAMHMNEVGESCFPSISTIQEEAGLSRPAVVKHLQLAEKEGWIVKSQHGYAGQKWKRNEYQAAIPASYIERRIEALKEDPKDTRKVVNLVNCLAQLASSDAVEGGKPGYERWLTSLTKVVNQVNSSSSVNSPGEVNKKQESRAGSEGSDGKSEGASAEPVEPSESSSFDFSYEGSKTEAQAAPDQPHSTVTVPETQEEEDSAAASVIASAPSTDEPDADRLAAETAPGPDGTPSEWAMVRARRWYELVEDRPGVLLASHRNDPEGAVARWAEAFDRLLKRGHAPEDVDRVCKWLFQTYPKENPGAPFDWVSDAIRTPNKLLVRSKKQDGTWFEVIYAKWEQHVEAKRQQGIFLTDEAYEASRAARVTKFKAYEDDPNDPNILMIVDGVAIRRSIMDEPVKPVVMYQGGF